MSGSSFHSQRQHVRYAIELSAEVISQRQPAMPCLIVDFCMGGFFLEVDSADDRVKSFESRESVGIRFQTGLGQVFQLDAKIVHLAPSGFGVAVEQMPPLAYSALLNEAGAGGKPASRRAPVQQPMTPPPDVGGEFGHDFRMFLAQNTDALIQGFFGTVKHDLEQRNLRSAQFANRSCLDDFVSTLMESRKPVVEAFRDGVCSQVDYLTEKFRGKEALSIDSRELSLVEKDAFEDWLNMSAIIRRLNNRFEEPVNQITRELARILGTFGADINNPARPSVLCDSFRESLQTLKLESALAMALYQIFEANLNAHLDTFYQQTVGFLKAQASRTKRGTSAAPHASAPSASPSAFSFDNDNVMPIEFDMAMFPDSEPVIPISSKSSRDRRVEKPSVAKVSGKLLDIITELSSALHGESPMDLAEEPDTFYPLEEILDALLRLQHSLPDNQSEPHEFQRRLEALLTTTDNAPKTFAARERSRIEVSERFFQTLTGNPHLSPLLKAYFRKIQLPLLLSSLEGRDFLDDEGHPAREVMNQLALLETALKSNKVVKAVNVKDTVDRLVDKIARESDANPGVFHEVAGELRWLAAEVTKSRDVVTSRVIEAYEGRQKLELARHTVQQALYKRLGGWRIPVVISDLLEAGWRQLLVIAELTEQQHPEEKPLCWSVLDDLIDWLGESDTVLATKAASIQQTIEMVSEKLKSIFADVGQRNRVIEQLMAILIGVGEPPERQRAETHVFEAAPIGPSDPFPAINDAFALQVEQLKVGDWLSVVGEKASFEAMKLIWIGDFLKCYVFVNRDGLNKREFSANELADALRQGTAKAMENLEEPLMERATGAMLQTMHENVVANAVRDPSTEALTYDEFIKQFKHCIGKGSAEGHVLVQIEVLDFRLITNVCGPEGGVSLLKTVADRVRAILTPKDIFGRFREKSFVMLLKDCRLQDAKTRLKDWVDKLDAEHFQCRDSSYPVSVSVGVVACGPDSIDPVKLVQQVDAASLSAKDMGRNQLVIFTEDDQNLNRQHSINEWGGRIDRILADGRLFTRCQKITSIQPGQAAHEHYEILLGIRDEDGRIMPPDVFIPAVERCKRMPEIDRWVIEDVLRWIENHTEMFGYCDGFSINLSGQSVNSHAFLEFLTAKLEAAQAFCEKLTFEITETVASDDIAFTIRFIETIKRFGCKFSLDDFGSGYSSYAYLKNLRVDYLKIDGAFIKDLDNNKADVAIVKSMNEIGHSLGMQTIAEYVENAEIQTILTDIGVDFGQGFHIHKPMPLAELAIEAPKPLYLFEDDSFWDI